MNALHFPFNKWSTVTLCILFPLVFFSCTRDSELPGDGFSAESSVAEIGEGLQPPTSTMLTLEARFAREFHIQALDAIKKSIATTLPKTPNVSDAVQTSLNMFFDEEQEKKMNGIPIDQHGLLKYGQKAIKILTLTGQYPMHL